MVTITAIIQNVVYVLIYLFVIGLSTVKQINKEHEIIENTSIGSRNSYGYFKKEIVFRDEHGNKIFGFFQSNHSILDHLKLAVYDFNKHFPNIVNVTFQSDLGKLIFGFYRHNVTFTLYTRELEDGFILRNVTELPKDFNKTKTTIFCAHGWMSTGKSPTCQVIKNELSRQSDLNIFIVDWSAVSNIPVYPIPAAATRVVAVYYADFLNDLIEKTGVELHNIHLIGHSLGAHLTGFTGRSIRRGKVARITGLDPALPSFTIVPNDHLATNDAEFVDVIHTCGGFLGIKMPIGHVDFYPNGGGPPQPGCQDDWQTFESCSHGRSYEYFADSISRKELYMTSRKEDDDSCHSIPMGYHTPHHSRGVYFLQTK